MVHICSTYICMIITMHIHVYTELHLNNKLPTYDQYTCMYNTWVVFLPKFQSQFLTLRVRTIHAAHKRKRIRAFEQLVFSRGTAWSDALLLRTNMIWHENKFSLKFMLWPLNDFHGRITAQRSRIRGKIAATWGLKRKSGGLKAVLIVRQHNYFPSNMSDCVG